MPIEIADIRIGACYRAGEGELRQVRAIVEDEVSYVVVFHALHRISVGPLERMKLARFADEADRNEPCP